jgi:hypothetical protein
VVWQGSAGDRRPYADQSGLMLTIQRRELPRRIVPTMKRILSEVLRRQDGVERRDGRAGALRIEFIERSRNQLLGIEWFFAADGAEWST